LFALQWSGALNPFLSAGLVRQLDPSARLIWLREKAGWVCDVRWPKPQRSRRCACRDRRHTRRSAGLRAEKEPTVADNIELIMRFHPVGGEDVSLISADFGGEAEALETIARALDERRSLVLTHARYNRETGENSMVINLANVVSVRVSKTDSDESGQYL
jgi:hypothetical protein